MSGRLSVISLLAAVSLLGVAACSAPLGTTGNTVESAVPPSPVTIRIYESPD